MPLSVLVVDDSALSRKLVIRGFPPDWARDVRQAANGKEAMSALSTALPDLMLLDLTMPEMDGYEVLAACQGQGIGVCTIVLSADIQPRALERVLALGAAAFLKKPFDRAGLESVLTRIGKR